MVLPVAIVLTRLPDVLSTVRAAAAPVNPAPRRQKSPKLSGTDSTSRALDLMTSTLGAVLEEPSPGDPTPMSQFGAEKFTTRSREAIEAAQLSATTAGNTNTEPIHLLVALLRQVDGTAR